jgi:hypothetical protein
MDHQIEDDSIGDPGREWTDSRGFDVDRTVEESEEFARRRVESLDVSYGEKNVVFACVVDDLFGVVGSEGEWLLDQHADTAAGQLPGGLGVRAGGNGDDGKVDLVDHLVERLSRSCACGASGSSGSIEILVDDCHQLGTSELTRHPRMVGSHDAGADYSQS